MPLDTKPNWAEVMITAEALREQFESVRIVPTTTIFRHVLRQQALAKIEAVQASQNEHTIRMVEMALVNSKSVSVRESITFNEEGIHVVINDKNIINYETTMCKVMDMISTAVEQLPNKKGTLEFGEPIQYTIPEMPHLLRV